jgi:hypothetical protein
MDLDMRKKKKYVENATNKTTSIDILSDSLKTIRQTPMIPKKKKAEKIYDKNIAP